MTQPYPIREVCSDDAHWREREDPHKPWCVWRCRAFVLEFRWKGTDFWFPRDFAWSAHYGDEDARITNSTPERETLWLDLFLHP